MKKVLKVILVLLILIGVFMAVSAIYFSRGLAAGEKVAVAAVDPTSLSDGSYSGRYEAGRWTNEVSVMVQGGKITGIEVVKDVRFASEDIRNEIFNRVIGAQNTTVDVVAQSTVTSKAYLKSIEDALTK